MKADYFSHIKNPMTIIALFVGLTEVGFGVAFSKAPENLQSTFLYLMASLAFLYIIGFFLLLFFRPSHLYGPSDFRKDEAYLAASRSLGTSQALARIAGKEQQQRAEPLNIDILKAIVDHLFDPLCWYLLRTTNKTMPANKHVEVLVAELQTAFGGFAGVEPTSLASGLFLGLFNLTGLLFEVVFEEDKQEKITVKMSPEVLNLIVQKLHPEMTNNPQPSPTARLSAH